MILSKSDATAGGTQKQAWALAAELRSRGLAVSLLTKPPRGGAAGTVLPACGPGGAAPPVTRLWTVGRHPGWSFLVSFLAWATLNRRRFDVIHAHNTALGVIACLAGWLTGRRVIVKIPGIRYVDYLTGGSLPRRLRRWILLRGTDRFVVVSREMAEALAAAGVPPRRIALIPNGVIVGPPAIPSRREVLKSEWLGTAAARVVLFVGRLVHEKGLDGLLEVWAAMPRSGDLLVLVGDGPLRRSLEARAHALGLQDSVRFLGHQTDVAPFYDMADVFVLPSRTEGVSNALLEAMAAGLPPVVSDVGGNRDIVEDGQSGFLLERTDTGAWVGTLSRLLDDPGLRGKVGDAARQRAERFAIGDVARRYQDLYGTVVSGERAR